MAASQEGSRALKSGRLEEAAHKGGARSRENSRTVPCCTRPGQQDCEREANDYGYHD